MIINFSCSNTKKIFDGNLPSDKKFIPEELYEHLQEILILIDEAKSLQDFWLFPSLKVKPVQGIRGKDKIYEVRINKRYRVYFKWEEPNAYNVKAGDHL